MRLTIIHPCIGRRVGEPYIRLWQMEPLPAATLAGMTPPGVNIAFYDDRMEYIPYDQPADLVAISVETYTARRAYEIASEYRRRGVPVVMGGFHATLCPQEVARFADAVVVGEAEGIWPQVLADAARGTLQAYYHAATRPALSGLRPDRSIFAGKAYLPVGLVEAGRGCHLRCEFCAVQTVFQHSQTRRPVEEILDDIRQMRGRRLIFFVDDNIGSNIDQAKEFMRALISLKIRWVSQTSINVAYDEEYLELMARSGCVGVLIGFESLNPETLRAMRKGVNLAPGGYEQALANLRRHNIRLYITFVFGYDEDTDATFDATVDFALRHRFYIAAFNHLTPFPGTPLYQRLEAEGRLLYDAWWLDERYSYNQLPFRPARMSAERVQAACVAARARFYGARSIWRRGIDRVNRSDFAMWWNFYGINAMFRREVRQRDFYPLGDRTWQGELLPVRANPPLP